MAPNLIRIGRRSAENYKKYDETATFADAFFHVPFLGGIKSRKSPFPKIGHWGWLCWGKGGLAAAADADADAAAANAAAAIAAAANAESHSER